MSASSFYSSFSYSLGGSPPEIPPRICCYWALLLRFTLFARLSFISWIRPPPDEERLAPVKTLMLPWMWFYLSEEAWSRASFILASTKLCGSIDIEELFKLSSPPSILSFYASLLSYLFLPLISLSRSSTFKFMMISMDDLMYSMIWNPPAFLINFFFSCSKWPSLI